MASTIFRNPGFPDAKKRLAVAKHTWTLSQILFDILKPETAYLYRDTTLYA